MPSAKILEAKKALVADLNEKIAGSLAGVVVAYNGISVADDTKLRKELREAGVHYMVVKNTMLRLAVKGTQYEGLTEYFKGDTAIALSPEDPAAAARILCKVLLTPTSPSASSSRAASAMVRSWTLAGIKSLVYHAQPRRPALHAGWLPQRYRWRSGCCPAGYRRQAGRDCCLSLGFSRLSAPAQRSLNTNRAA